MRSSLLKLAGLGLLVAGISSSALASFSPAPEIDPSLGVNALALLGGAILIFRSARRK